jgi:hypothetical protein
MSEAQGGGAWYREELSGRVLRKPEPEGCHRLVDAARDGPVRGHEPSLNGAGALQLKPLLPADCARADRRGFQQGLRCGRDDSADAAAADWTASPPTEASSIGSLLHSAALAWHAVLNAANTRDSEPGEAEDGRVVMVVGDAVVVAGRPVFVVAVLVEALAGAVVVGDAVVVAGRPVTVVAVAVEELAGAVAELVVDAETVDGDDAEPPPHPLTVIAANTISTTGATTRHLKSGRARWHTGARLTNIDEWSRREQPTPSAPVDCGVDEWGAFEGAGRLPVVVEGVS